jgi:hypothetical protein
MKTPRVTDFDPDAKAPILKSSLDSMPAIVKPSSTHLRKTSEKHQQQTNPDTSERPNASTPVRPNGKRIITRNSFEIYEDQMDSLRKLSYQEKMDGQLGSMSNMVRDAIDQYLLKRVQKK